MTAFPLLAAGSLASSVGGALGAQSANRNARKARDWYDLHTQIGSGMLGNAFLGPSYNNNLLYSGDPNERTQGMDQITGALGGPLWQQLQALSQRGTQGRSNILRDFDNNSSSILKFGGDSTGRVQDYYGGARTGAMGRFDQGTSQARGIALGSEDIARGYGAGAEALIDEDAQRATTRANRASDARLISMGLGSSSTRASTAANNEANISREATRQKLDARRETTDRVLAARGQRTALEQGAAGTGLNGDLAFTGMQGGALENSLASQLAQLSQRSAMRTGVQQDNLAGNQSQQQGNILQALNLLSSSNMNPWLGQPTTQFYPGVSPAGSALTSAGNAAAMLGAYGLFNTDPKKVA
ncbi:MAG: hypothetical protein H6815_00415 [Phycisphaeraceae bacterium]|nr:hypothetical protein [Phycisphaerales bacterium]MCB9858887.1 hypothetical protein [Phycisphaeraceae bacterium]